MAATQKPLTGEWNLLVSWQSVIGTIPATAGAQLKSAILNQQDMQRIVEIA